LQKVDKCCLLGANSADFAMKEDHKVALAQGKLLADPTRY